MLDCGFLVKDSALDFNQQTEFYFAHIVDHLANVNSQMELT